MSPIKVFLSIFAGGILLAVILGSIGLYQYTDAPDDGNGNEENVIADAPSALVNNCLSCHGDQLQGATGPDLIGVEYTEEEIIDILQNGIGTMQPQEQLDEDEMESIAEYLVDFEG